MDSVVQYFASQGLDFWEIMKICLILLGGTLLISLLSRLIFGRHAIINSAISSAIGILFIYTLQIVIYTFPNLPADFSRYVTPLPLTAITGTSLSFFQFEGAAYTLICSQLLSLIILAFIMNLADRWIPKGNNMITWLCFRIITILISITIHNVILKLFNTLMPEGVVTHAPAILLGLLVLMLLTGALKLLVGALMATVNPFIAALYTFFFASFLGKQITKAVFTTGILASFVYFLNKMGIAVISIAPAALIAYIPFAVALVAMWYITIKNM